MADDRTTRRLTTIVAADIAGYSRLMGADEEGTLAALRAHRSELIEPEINNHGGRIANTAGDSFLLEFPSVVDALRCVIGIQAGMARRNADVPADQRIEFRVGINVGDVMAEGEDLFGDGVNIAARIEGLAEPGGICLSRTARDNVRDRMDIDLEDLGEVEVKNIARPVRVFRVLGEGETARAPAAPAKPTWKRYAAAVIVLAIIAGAGGWWWWQQQPDFAPADPAKLAFKLPDKPSIAVLPFKYLGPDAEANAYIATGLSETIVSSLGSMPFIFIIDWAASKSLDADKIGLGAVAEKLGVQYVLKGSVQRSGDDLRISVHLSDTKNGRQIWSTTFDRAPAKLFEIQDEIAKRMLAALEVNFGTGDFGFSAARTTSNLKALKFYNQGRAEFGKYTKEGRAKANKLFSEAEKEDPKFVAALIFRSISYLVAGRLAFVKDRRGAIAGAMKLADKAAAIRPGYIHGLSMQGYLDLWREQYARAIERTEQAFEKFPNHSGINRQLAQAYLYNLRPDDALAALDRAERLQAAPSRFSSWARIIALVDAGKYPTALKWIGRYRRTFPPSSFTFTFVYEAIALSELGQVDKARAVIKSLKSKKPKINIRARFDRLEHPYKGDWAFKKYTPILARLGLPENPPTDKPSLAILSFDNLSGDAAQEYFADGFTDSLIAAVSKISELFVIARNSTFTYKGKATKVQRIAEELGVRYIVEGSIQRAGQRIRVTAQLIDGKTGEHLWAEKYDRDLDDTFALQDEIIQKIATEMRVKLTEGEYARSSFYICKNSIEATELAWKASDALRRFTKEDNVLVRRLSEQAVKLAPNCSGAWFVLSLGYFLEVAYGWSEDPAADLKKSAEIVDHALSIDDKFPDLYLVQAQIEAVSGAHDKAVAFAEKALKLDPNHTMNLAVAAGVYNRAGLPEKGLTAIKKVIRRSPRDLSWYPAELLRSLVFIGKFDEVISVGESYVKSEAGFYTTKAHEQLAYAYGQLGRTDEAKAHIATILKRQPDYTITTIKPIDLSQYKDRAFVERYYDRLQALGLPK